jgi:hypothetical protein
MASSVGCNKSCTVMKHLCNESFDVVVFELTAADEFEESNFMVMRRKVESRSDSMSKKRRDN